MNKLLIVILFFCSGLALGQETDPLERNTSSVKYADKTKRVDTTASFYIDQTFRIIDYGKGGWEYLYEKYFDAVDKNTGKRVTRIDIPAIARSMGIVDGKIWGLSAKATDSIIVLGDPLMVFDLRTGKQLYIHQQKNDHLYPILVDSKIIALRGHTSMQMPKLRETSRNVFVLLDKQYKERVRILYRSSKEPKVISTSDFLIELLDGKIKISSELLLDRPANIVSMDTVRNVNRIAIGGEAISIVDNGKIGTSLTYFEGTEKRYIKKVDFDKFNGELKTDSIQDGEYNIQWSDYLPVETNLTIKNGRITVSKPYLKVTDNTDHFLIKYQGFNSSHSSFMDSLGLRIMIFK